MGVLDSLGNNSHHLLALAEKKLLIDLGLPHLDKLLYDFHLVRPLWVSPIVALPRLKLRVQKIWVIANFLRGRALRYGSR